MSRAPIGIFDSGLGGLTVTAALFDRLPQESTIYFGDTARVPYGPKSPTTVRRYCSSILEWLLGQGVKAVVIACNTSSAHALEELRAVSPVPVLGVIEPGAKAAAAVTQSGRIGVIGTGGTVASGAYVRALHALNPGLEIIQQACPLFVPFVEEGWFTHPATELVAREYLGPLISGGIDTLVLGCTHYPLLRPLLGKILGPDVALIDSAVATADAVVDVLEREGLRVEGREEPPTHRFAVSDEAQRFTEVGTRFLGARLTSVEVVALSA
jgi:glutamate racemase